MPLYTVPQALSCLTEAEKLLISIISVYAPLQHLSKGQLGSKGHVCCFEKDMTDFCTELPCLPDHVSVIRVLHKFNDKEGGEVGSKAFSVRCHKVLALLWLKKHNPLYLNINIRELYLDWIEDNVEQELPGDVFYENGKEVHPSMEDQGPAPVQVVETIENEDRRVCMELCYLW